MTRALPRLLLTVALVAAACSTPKASSTTSPPMPEAEPATEFAEGSIPLIVDYSPTVSDVGALLYLLSHPGVDVLAVTLPGAGEAGCDLGYDVTFGILAMFGRSDIPVACDPEIPSHAEEWPEEFLTGASSLTFGLPEGEAAPDPRPAHQLIADAVAGSQVPVTIYAVGPLTNIARAIDRHPEVVPDVGGIVIMGGAVDAPGNVPGTGAEWNFWIDGRAVDTVLSSGADVTLVPLDATNDVPIPPLWRADLEAAEQSDAVVYLTGLVRIFPAVTSGFFYMWDELAAAVAAGEDLVAVEGMGLVIADDGSTDRDAAGVPTLVGTAVADPDGFYAHFLETISGRAVAEREVVTFDETTIPDTIDASSTREEVLAFWMVNGAKGEVEAAGSVIAPGARWVGFGDSPAVYAEGAAPYEVYDVELTCSTSGAVVICTMTFRDRWVDSIPELERGGLSTRAEVENGQIVAFQAFAFDAATADPFNAQAAWLETEQPAVLDEACGPSNAALACSELFVATVEEWVASR